MILFASSLVVQTLSLASFPGGKGNVESRRVWRVVAQRPQDADVAHASFARSKAWLPGQKRFSRRAEQCRADGCARLYTRSGQAFEAIEECRRSRLAGERCHESVPQGWYACRVSGEVRGGTSGCTAVDVRHTQRLGQLFCDLGLNQVQTHGRASGSTHQLEERPAVIAAVSDATKPVADQLSQHAALRFLRRALECAQE